MGRACLALASSSIRPSLYFTYFILLTMAQPFPPEIHPLPDPPSDGVTALSYLGDENSTSKLLAASSWDGSIRIYDTVQRKLVCSHLMDAGPILSLATPPDSSSKLVFTGGLDGSVKKFDVHTNQKTTLGYHSDQEVPTGGDSKFAVSCIVPVLKQQGNGTHIVASAGWDSKFCLWDARRGLSKALCCIPLPGKAFSMDVDPSSNMDRVVVTTAGRRVCIIDLKMNSSHYTYSAHMVLDREASLKYQTRVAKFLPDGSGIALGSVEGRVAIEYLDELGVDSRGRKKYAFKCHRVGDTIYPVNAIAFHPKYGTFATGGCDQTCSTWDGFNKKKIFSLPPFPTSVAALAFSRDGSELAIAASYTFEEGDRDHPRDEIFTRAMLEGEIRPKDN